MLIKVRLQSERFMTPRTLEILIGGMRLHMRPQIGPIRERLAAMRAPIRLLPGMRPQMALQQPRPREELTAYPARVIQLMREQMHSQRRHTHVRFPAGNAFLRRLRIQASMSLLMSRQVGRGRVLFPALGARILGPLVADGGHDGRGTVHDGFLLRSAIADEKRLVRIRNGLGWCRFCW